jgi:DNA-binding MarR family transcriptional regulator
MRFKDFVEQTGAFDILLVLAKKDSLSMTELVHELLPRSSTTTYAAFQLLKRYGLVNAIKAKDRSKRIDIELSQKGRNFMEHAQAMEKLLNEQ